jgi:hypothetical protein
MRIRTQAPTFLLFLAALLGVALVHQAATAEPVQPPSGPSVDPAPFFATVAQRYQVPPQQVRALARGGLPPGQVVVVYYVAEHSLRQPAQILAARQAGGSWRDIARASGLQPETFYYPLAYRGPFVNVYALYHRLPRDRWTWDQLPLSDADVENLVNLRFLAGLAGRGAIEAERLRAAGCDFVSIHHFLLSGQKTAQRTSSTAAAAVLA